MKDKRERNESLEPKADIDLGGGDWAKSPPEERTEPNYNENQDQILND